jgi:hypothetical protein
VKRDLPDTELAAARHAAVFGYFWEMVHRRSGTVVGEGFSRQLPTLRRQPGYDYRLTRVAEIDRRRPWAP